MTRMKTVNAELEDFGTDCVNVSHGSVPTVKKIWVTQDIFDELRSGGQIATLTSYTPNPVHVYLLSVNNLSSTIDIDICTYPPNTKCPLDVKVIVSHSLWIVGGIYKSLISSVPTNNTGVSVVPPVVQHCDCTLGGAHETWCDKWQAYTAD